MGKGKFNKISLTHIARGVYSVTIPAKRIGQADIEYHIKVSSVGGQEIYFPAAAPHINQTVVIMASSVRSKSDSGNVGASVGVSNGASSMLDT